MPIKILMPALSPTMSSGNLARWLKSEGDVVKAGEIIAEIETDKATMELEVVDEGVIAKILVAEGSKDVKVNSLLAVLLEEGEDQTKLETFLINPENAQGVIKQEAVALVETKPEQHVQQANSTVKKDRILASPLAKRMAQQAGIDLTSITGSGPRGRIIKQDLETISQMQQQTEVKSSVSRLANSNIRKIIAKRLLESKQTIPHFYLSIECNLGKLLAVRQEINSSLIEKEDKISMNDFIVLAVAKTLREVKEVNASWTEEAIEYYSNIDIAVAVAIEGGLITPVIRNADSKDILRLSREIKELAKKARDNRLRPEEFQGGSFTISNLGMYGVKNFNAIINPPQSCILAVGMGTKRPTVIDDELVVATMMDVTLSCDHRVVDGVIGTKFLSQFKRLVEQPLLALI